MPPSALSQVVEAGPQCGETSAELPYAFRILRPAHVPIISARLTGVNRRAIYGYIIKPLPAFEWVTTIYCGSSHSGCTPRRAAGVKGGEAAEPCEGPLDGSQHRGQMAVR